jgi:hypothetical protein
MRSACTTNWCMLFKKYANTVVSVPISLAHLRSDLHLLHPGYDSGSAVPQVWATNLILPPCLQNQTAPSVISLKDLMHPQSQRCRQCVPLKCVFPLETVHCVAFSGVENCSLVCIVIAGGYQKQIGLWMYMNLPVIDYLSKICFTYIFKPPLCTAQLANLQVDSFSFQLSPHLIVTWRFGNCVMHDGGLRIYTLYD